MNDIKDLCTSYLQLQDELERIKKSMSLVETCLERQRRELHPDNIHKIPTTFYMRLKGDLYRLDFDEEDTSFISLKKDLDTQILD